MDTMPRVTLAAARLRQGLRRRRRRRKARKALAHMDRGLQYLRAEEIRIPQEVLHARWRIARSIRQKELDRRLDRVEYVVADLREAGLTVLAWHVGANLDEVNFGFSSDLDIHVHVPHHQAKEAARVASRLTWHWWRDGRGLLVNVLPRVGTAKPDTGLSRGNDVVCGAAHC